MAGPRLVVRVSRAVFDEIDRALGTERGPNGEPSANDFLTIDLLPIVDTFATRFESLPEVIEGRLDYRVLISAGVLVHAVVVVGQLVSDGSVELISIRLDSDREMGRRTGRAQVVSFASVGMITLKVETPSE